MRKRKKSSVIKEIEQAATSTEDAAVEEYEKGAQQSPRR